MAEDTDFGPGRKRFAIVSWVCRGGLIPGTEQRHAACPGDLGHITFLDDEDYKCECPCHKIGFEPKAPVITIGVDGRMSPEDAEALLK